MDFKDFVQYMRKESEKKLGLEVRTVDTVKNNGLKLTGLVFEDKGTNAYVTLYLNNMYDQYQKGVELSQLVDTICEQYEQSRFTYSLDLSDFLDYEKAQKKIAFKLVNYNQNRDMLKNMPHRRFLDLAIVYYYVVDNAPFNGRGSIKIDNTHLKEWGITEEQLYQNAMETTPVLLPASIVPISECMKDMVYRSIRCAQNKSEQLVRLLMQLLLLEELEREDCTSMYVIKNRLCLNGAGCILYDNILKNFAETMGDDLYILPSSIHETILIPVSDNQLPEYLREMVREINHTNIEVEERLADNVYVYKRSTDTIEIA